MSTIRVNSIQHSGAANASIELNANGRVAFSNTVAFTSNNVTIGGQALSPVTGMRNRIINGDMRIDQRNAGASVATSSSVEVYTLDRWIAFYSATSKYTVQQNAGSVTPPTGFINYLGVTSSSAYSVGASERFCLIHKIEGFNLADLGWGTVDAKTVTLSFWVRSSLTGTFGGAFRNDAGNRSYPFTYNISSSNTWEYKVITLNGPTSGTFNITNGTGIQIWFGLGVGSSLSGTANSWANSDFSSATGAVSIVGTNGATFYITGVQLEEGSVATSFERRPFGLELALCQRYYEVGELTFYFTPWSSSSLVYFPVIFTVQKRAMPTVTRTGVGGVSGSTSGTTVSATAVTTTGFYWEKTGTVAIGGSWTASIEL